jgi:hypothetical protein
MIRSIFFTYKKIKELVLFSLLATALVIMMSPGSALA